MFTAVCESINFERYLNVLIKLFSNYLKNGKRFQDEIKSIINHFEGLSLKQKIFILP